MTRRPGRGQIDEFASRATGFSASPRLLQKTHKENKKGRKEAGFGLKHVHCALCRTELITESRD